MFPTSLLLWREVAGIAHSLLPYGLKTRNLKGLMEIIIIGGGQCNYRPIHAAIFHFYGHCARDSSNLVLINFSK